jgi:predicted acyltransferase
MKVVEPLPTDAVEPRPLGFVADRLKLRAKPKVERRERTEVVETVLVAGAEDIAKASAQAKQKRLVSIDAFRGLTVILMLIVNNMALDTATPDAFTHAGWNQGLRLADFVFPWFLLCVGLSIPFSFASFKKKGLPSWRLDLKIIGRTIGLIALGCVINAAISRQVVFTLGVLQLIGLAYFLAAYSYELPMFRRGVIATAMLLGYGMAIKFLPIPGSTIGSFTENVNFIDHINRTYLLMYNLDGLFSAIPTAALMIYAGMVGEALMSPKLDHLTRLVVMLVVGLTMAGLGILVNNVLPYNKPVWTPSYLLLTGGVGILLVCGLYLFTDAIKWTKWPYLFLVFGSNAILAYVLPVMCKVMIFSVWTISSRTGKITVQEALLDSLVNRFGRMPGGWAYTSLYIGFWWLVLLVLYRKRVFLRV